MSHAAVERTLSLLAFAGLFGVALTWAGALFQRLGVGRLGSRIAGLVDGAEIGLGWVVAATAMVGSLYFSEVANYIPCLLCWYQRITMYPLVILLLVAMLRRERVIAPYALFLSLVGLLVSVYHYQLERFPNQSSICSATASVPCEVKWFEHFGISTIPFLAGSSFLMIGTLMALAWHNERRSSAEVDESGTTTTAATDEDEDEDQDDSGVLILAIGLVVLVVAGAIGAVLVLRADNHGSGSTATSTPIVQPGDPVNGEVLFASAACGGCHVFTPAASRGTAGPSLDGTRLDEASLIEKISVGKGAMPGYSRDLSTQEIADLVAFVRQG